MVDQVLDTILQVIEISKDWVATSASIIGARMGNTQQIESGHDKVDGTPPNIW